MALIIDPTYPQWKRGISSNLATFKKSKITVLDLKMSPANRYPSFPTAMKRFSFFLILILVLVVAGGFSLAERKLRLGRDLIFHSSDIVEFTLPNGKAVRTNRWCNLSDLLNEGQEFYFSPEGLGIMLPNVDGFARVTDEGSPASYLRILRTHETILSMADADQPLKPGVVQMINTAGYTEYWVCRQDQEASQ